MPTSRAASQREFIITALQAGPVTTDDLAAICLQYSARIAELRKLGWDIECYDENHKTGIAKYRLNTPEPILREFLVPVKIRLFNGRVVQDTMTVQAPNVNAAQWSAKYNAAKVLVGEECA